MALFAAAGLFVGGVAMPSAKAADLGGDCCADLEERVAELEATTARKGNRKMSLTVTGQVDRLVMWWDDGHTSRAYYGLDNINASSRFVFLGSARINPSVQMGFEIMLEQSSSSPGSSLATNQLDEDGKRAGTNPLGNFVSGNAPQSNSDSYFGAARRVAWWIEHKDLGRITVGRYESAGAVTTIDLGGIFMVASSSFLLLNGGFFLRSSAGQWYNMTWGNVTDPAANQGRTELVRYDSPTYMGFIYSASIAEAGDYWGQMLRYAGEFSGFRIAAGIGMEHVTDRNTPVTVDPTAAFYVGPAPNQTFYGAAASVMHVPTGLFVQGHYMTGDYNDPNHVASGYWGSAGGATKLDWAHWLVQAGIAKNWFGIGNTALYGEYGRSEDFGAESAGRNYPGTVALPSPFNPAANATANFTSVFGVNSTDLRIWGVGITQNVDAAASTLYLGYRNFDVDVGCRVNCLTGVGGPAKLDTEQIHVVVGGAIVRF